jgi:hypothetical protein
MHKLSSINLHIENCTDLRYKASDFSAIVERMKAATQVKTQTELAAILEIGKAAISDAKRRNIIPADWLLKLSRPPHRLNPAWLESGRGIMRIPHDGVADLASDYQNTIDAQFQTVPLARPKPSPAGSCLAVDTSCEPLFAFARTWLEQRGAPGQLKLLRVSGDSMRPALHDDDIVLIDESQKDIREGKIYAIRIDSDVVVKRVAKKPGALTLISDNRDLYDTLDVDVDHSGNIEIIGRVVWMARESL